MYTNVKSVIKNGMYDKKIGGILIISPIFY